MLKNIINKIAPYLNRGRWYKFFIEVDDGAYKITTKDIDCSTTGTSLKIPNMQIVDYVLDIHNDTASVVNVDKSVRLFADGSQGVVLPSPANTDYFTVWVFGHRI